jgi:putative DeoR family transcriptional regulator (stage III sporulation protein D)
LQYDIYTRVIKEGEYIVKHNTTVRATANYFGVSKSTVHTDLSKRLKRIDKELYRQVKNLLFINLSERHIRGGIATRNKFKGQ